MVIDELDVSAEYRLSRILNLLEQMYNLALDFDAVNSEDDLTTIYEKYDSIRRNIIRETQYNTYNQNAEYTKACLVQEAIYIFLREIAPKRLNRHRRHDGSRFKEQT